MIGPVEVPALPLLTAIVAIDEKKDFV